MIEVLLEALKDVLAAITELAMAAIEVKVSIKITTQKPSWRAQGSLLDERNYKNELEQRVHS